MNPNSHIRTAWQCENERGGSDTVVVLKFSKGIAIGTITEQEFCGAYWRNTSACKCMNVGLGGSDSELIAIFFSQPLNLRLRALK